VSKQTWGSSACQKQVVQCKAEEEDSAVAKRETLVDKKGRTSRSLMATGSDTMTAPNNDKRYNTRINEYRFNVRLLVI
jgi:hypothetical protein